MEKYYHMTEYKNLDSIMEQGLIPTYGDRTRLIGDERRAVFFSKGIANAIRMYCNLRSYYESRTEEKGAKAIKFYEEKLNGYKQLEKEGNELSEENLKEIEAIHKVIENTKEMMNYNDFFEYIGEGVYLTFSDVENVESFDEKDCYTFDVISPDKINIVLLKNKETEEIVDDREAIIAHFMSITDFQDLTSKLHDVIEIHNLGDLYDERIFYIDLYKSSDYEMIEVPLSSYLSDKENKSKDKRSYLYEKR